MGTSPKYYIEDDGLWVLIQINISTMMAYGG